MYRNGRHLTVLPELTRAFRQAQETLLSPQEIGQNRLQVEKILQQLQVVHMRPDHR